MDRMQNLKLFLLRGPKDKHSRSSGFKDCAVIYKLQKSEKPFITDPSLRSLESVGPDSPANIVTKGKRGPAAERRQKRRACRPLGSGPCFPLLGCVNWARSKL